MRPFLDRLKSRKFLMTLAAFIVGGLKAVYPDLPDQALWSLIGVAMGYVAVEGAIDLASVNQSIDAAADLAKWTAGKKYEGTD